MKILLATDGSESANSAVDFMRRYPMPPDTELTLITVIDKEMFGGKLSSTFSEDQRRILLETKRMLRKDAAGLLAESAAKLGDIGLVPSTIIATGHPSREIVRAAKRLSADIVVVGTHGLGEVKRFLLGSTSDDVMHYAHCSVLVVRACDAMDELDRKKESQSDTSPHPFRVLLAFDNSAPARKATELCASMSPNKDIEVTALSVMPLIHMFRQDIRQQLSWVWQERKKVTKKGLEWVSETLSPVTSKVSTQLKESSDVSHEILDAAKEADCDLVVIGNKGEGAVKQFLLGSVTRRIVHHAPCSVLAVSDYS